MWVRGSQPDGESGPSRVGGLYEQVRVIARGAFDALEEEQMGFGGEMEAAGWLDGRTLLTLC